MRFPRTLWRDLILIGAVATSLAFTCGCQIHLHYHAAPTGAVKDQQDEFLLDNLKGLLNDGNETDPGGNGESQAAVEK